MPNNQAVKNQIVFAAISPHAPILLPDIGSPEDRSQVKNTIESLEKLGGQLTKLNPRTIIISSPHQDWGFNVPLYFLAKNFKGEINTYLIGLESPKFYFEEGKKIYKLINQTMKQSKIALVASGDLSHCLKADGPYGLKKKDIEKILKLDDLYPDAGECGLRSFCFILGILEESKINYEVEILSHEGPFGVGYLVANFKLI